MSNFASHYISFAKRMRNERPWLWRLMCKLIEPLRFKGMAEEECEKILKQVHPDIHSTSKTSNPPSTNVVDLQIIVPVYNVERTLAECLDSILSQETEYSYKVTIVNDGSPDKSLAVARRYEADPRVQIICQENRGLSGARNAALRQMCGKYVLFVDSDDRLTEGAIETLMNAAINHPDFDIIVGGYNEIELNGDYIKTVMSNYSFPEKKPVGYPWGKVMKSAIWEKIQWPEGYWFEDTILAFCLYKQFTVGSISNVVYDYRQNPQGIVGLSKGKPKNLDSFYITRALLKDCLDILQRQDLLDIFFSQVLMNRNRIDTIGSIELNRAVFFSTCNLFYSFLGSIEIKNENKLLLSALRNRNFILYSIL